MFFGLIRNSLTQNSFDYVLVVLSLYLKAIYWISFTGFPHPLHHPFSPMGGPLQIGFSLMFPPPPIESLFGTLKISVEAACYTVFNITTHCMFDTFRACMWLRSPILANLIRSQRVSFCRRNKELLYKQSKHRRRRMEREAKTKVVASVWGTKFEFILFILSFRAQCQNFFKKLLVLRHNLIKDNWQGYIILCMCMVNLNVIYFKYWFKKSGKCWYLHMQNCQYNQHLHTLLHC